MTGDPFKFKLGLFVVSGLALGVVGLLAVGAGEYFEENYPVYCYFERSVQGLEEGSGITYRGVQIGRVTTIGMNVREQAQTMGPQGSGALILVQAELFPDKFGLQTGFMGKTPDDVENYVKSQVARGLRVSLELAGITGQKYLELDFKDPMEFQPPEYGFLPRQPWIPTAKSPTLSSIQRDLASTLSALSRLDYEGIADRLVVILDSLNQQITDLDMKTLSGRADETLVAIKALAESPELRDAVGRLDSITKKLDSGAGRFDDLLAGGDLDRLVEDAAAAGAAVRRLTEGLETRVPEVLDSVTDVTTAARSAIDDARVGDTTASIRSAADEVGSAARNIVAMKEELRRAVRDMGQASRTVSRLARSLEEHPQSLITGKPLPGKE